MESIHKYKIIQNMNLIIEYHAGKLCYDEIIKFKTIQSKDDNYNANYNFLVDIREAEIMLSEDQIINIFKFVIDNKIMIGNRKVAQLTSTPNQVVTTILLEKHNIIPIQTNVFSTMEAAIRFLGFSNIDLKTINGYIEELKK